MQKTVYLSATQIENFVRCERLWGWQKIEKIERPPAKALELGSRVHEILEKYYLGEEAPQLDEIWRWQNEHKLFYPGRIASQMISGAVPADVIKRAKPELAFANKTLGEAYGVIFVGKIDIHWISPITEGGSVLHIVDHKTSSDPEKWGKKEKDLPDDVQQLLYMRFGMEAYPHVTRGQFTLNYGSTALQKTKNYWVYYNQGRRTIIRDFDKKIEPIARYMADAKRQVTNVLDLEPNPAVCQMFGGCPFADRCQLTSKQKIGAFIMAGTTLKDKLAARIAASKGTPARATEPETDPINPPEQNDTPTEPAQTKDTSKSKAVSKQEEKISKAIAKSAADCACGGTNDELLRLLRNLNSILEKALR